MVDVYLSLRLIQVSVIDSFMNDILSLFCKVFCVILPEIIVNKIELPKNIVHVLDFLFVHIFDFSIDSWFYLRSMLLRIALIDFPNTSFVAKIATADQRRAHIPNWASINERNEVAANRYCQAWNSQNSLDFNWDCSSKKCEAKKDFFHHKSELNFALPNNTYITAS